MLRLAHQGMATAQTMPRLKPPPQFYIFLQTLKALERSVKVGHIWDMSRIPWL